MMVITDTFLVKSQEKTKTQLTKWLWAQQHADECATKNKTLQSKTEKYWQKLNTNLCGIDFEE